MLRKDDVFYNEILMQVPSATPSSRWHVSLAKRRFAARALHIALLAGHAQWARSMDFLLGIHVSLGFTILWWLLELLILSNPGIVNVPGAARADIEARKSLDFATTVRATAPVFIAAGWISLAAGTAISALHALDQTTTAATLAVLLVPLTPLVLGVPFALLVHKMELLASTKSTP